MAGHADAICLRMHVLRIAAPRSGVSPLLSVGPHLQIGAAFLTKSKMIDGGPVKLEIWDTAGQERYRSLAPMYYRGAGAAMIVYDVTSKDSLEGAKSWVKELQKKADPNIVMVLVGNKADLTARRKVEAAEAKEYAASQGLLWIETSAKSNDQVELAFEMVAKAVLPKLKAAAAAAAEVKRDVVSLQQGKSGGKSKAGCCG